jgi:hypothetical protein
MVAYRRRVGRGRKLRKRAAERSTNTTCGAPGAGNAGAADVYYG